MLYVSDGEKGRVMDLYIYIYGLTTLEENRAVNSYSGCKLYIGLGRLADH